MNINDKPNNGQYAATEFNGFKNETQNTITGSGQSLSATDFNQLLKSILDLSRRGDFYSVTNSDGNAITMTNVTGTTSNNTGFKNGQKIRFIAAANNTGAVTVNPDGLGTRALVQSDGTALSSGDIISGREVVAVYIAASSQYRITTQVVSLNRVGSPTSYTSSQVVTVPTGATRMIARLYGAGGGGGAHIGLRGTDATATTLVYQTTTLTANGGEGGASSREFDFTRPRTDYHGTGVGGYLQIQGGGSSGGIGSVSTDTTNAKTAENGGNGGLVEAELTVVAGNNVTLTIASGGAGGVPDAQSEVGRFGGTGGGATILLEFFEV